MGKRCLLSSCDSSNRMGSVGKEGGGGGGTDVEEDGEDGDPIRVLECGLVGVVLGVPVDEVELPRVPHAAHQVLRPVHGLRAPVAVNVLEAVAVRQVHGSQRCQPTLFLPPSQSQEWVTGLGVVLGLEGPVKAGVGDGDDVGGGVVELEGAVPEALVEAGLGGEDVDGTLLVAPAAREVLAQPRLCRPRRSRREGRVERRREWEWVRLMTPCSLSAPGMWEAFSLTELKAAMAPPECSARLACFWARNSFAPPIFPPSPATPSLSWFFSPAQPPSSRPPLSLLKPTLTLHGLEFGLASFHRRENRVD